LESNCKPEEVRELTLSDEKMFDKLETLTMMNLRKNEITSIPENIFKSLKELKELFLSGNKLKMINMEVLRGISATVTTLTIDGNEISEFKVNSAAEMVKFKTLNLDGNRLTRIANDMFPANFVFVSMSFSQNNITEIVEKSFMKLQKLLKT
jgi:Leucine-rich repeat (LRR) protein